jgi:glucosylceramidase
MMHRPKRQSMLHVTRFLSSALFVLALAGCGAGSSVGTFPGGASGTPGNPSSAPVTSPTPRAGSGTSPTPAPTPTGTPNAATTVPPLGASPAAGSVAVYETTANLSDTLTRRPDLAFSSGTGSQSTQLTVTPATRYQTFTAGFGVALTDTASWLLQTQVSPATRNVLMNQLFSVQTGAGFSYIRVPMGGSDFNVSETPYTYDDLPAGETDPTLAKFSIDHDRAYIIPAIQQALSINPGIVIVSAPWSPPAWMKTDDSIVPKSVASTLLPADYGPWAQYFVKFINAYAAQGIRINQMSIQNEPLNTLLGIPSPTIPGMTFDPADAANFVTSDLVPAFKAAGLTNDIMAYDFVWEVDQSWVPAYMAIAQSDTQDLAFHCYLSDPTTMTLFNAEYRLPQFETECASKLSSLYPAQMTIRSLRNDASGIQEWNAALDQNAGPKFGSGCEGITGTPFSGQQCTAPVTINTATGAYQFTDDFWELAQFSRFIRQGAIRIDSTQPTECISGPEPPPCGPEGVAFQNPDGTNVLVVTTHTGSPETFDVVENGNHFTYTLPDGATVSFVWRPS